MIPCFGNDSSTQPVAADDTPGIWGGERQGIGFQELEFGKSKIAGHPRPAVTARSAGKKSY
jgi:hypothetical protein